MRSRTELVTTQLEGSEFEEESDFEDSEEDWKPSKDDPKGKSKVSPGRIKKTTASSKNGTKKRGRKPIKKSKKKTNSGEENDTDDENFTKQMPTPAKKVKKTPKKPADNVLQTDPTASTSEVKFEPTTSSDSSSKPQPLQRKLATPLKSFPDKGGFLTLYIFKGDMKDGIYNNHELCLWRRDGSSLLQKFLRDKSIATGTPQYNSSMVYSCWEDKRADEYLEIKVKCLEQAKQVRVELVDAEELEAKSRSEYDNYVAVYGVPPVRTNSQKSGDNSNRIAEDEDEDEDDDEYDELEDGEGEEEEEEE
ncbi:nucleolin-like [Malaya genurostris]|uniref:nucleolin-like n=1 Tax=Malaya genurostris TaxID=325434 RepID=UPI0026F3947C|nr:nucleolin-like [Malaya genurostris]XP_058456036.1 nucleolin-like [Malaya genurostris]